MVKGPRDSGQKVREILVKGPRDIGQRSERYWSKVIDQYLSDFDQNLSDLSN